MQKTHTYKRSLRASALALAMMLPAAALADTQMVVKGGALNLRKDPSLSAQVLGQYPTGTWMTVTETSGDWSHVTINGQEGYVMSKYLTDGTSTSTLYIRTNTGANLNLRDQPSLTGSIVASYKPGTAVSVILRGNGWYQVKINDTIGYMASRYLSSSVGSSSSTQTGYPKQGTVKNPGANQVLLLRETPSTDARVLAYFANGTVVTLNGESGSFYKVSIGSLQGYMMKKYIALNGAASGTQAVTPFKARLVNPNGNMIVNFRTAPGLNSPIIKAYPIGLEITVTAMGDVWCKAEIDGVSGYISKYFFTAIK